MKSTSTDGEMPTVETNAIDRRLSSNRGLAYSPLFGAKPISGSNLRQEYNAASGVYCRKAES